MKDHGTQFIGGTSVPVDLGTKPFREGNPDVGVPLGANWLLAVGKPWCRASAAEGIEAYASLIEEQRGSGPCELLHGKASQSYSPDDHFSRWNLIMKAMMPDLLASSQRFGRLALDLAMAEQVLDARLAAAVGQFGTTEVASERCADWRWTREVLPDGQFSLKWIGPEPWQAEHGMQVPLSVTSGSGD